MCALAWQEMLMCTDFIAFLQMLAQATDGYIGSPHPPRYLRTQWCRARWALDGSTPRCVALTLSAARSLSHLRRSVHRASFPQLNSQGMKSLISVRMRTRTSMPLNLPMLPQEDRSVPEGDQSREEGRRKRLLRKLCARTFAPTSSGRIST